MLACSIDLTLTTYPVLCTPKLDGIRCVVRGGVPLSRTLKPIRNNHVRKMFSGCPDNLDGELLVEGKTFNEIQSLLMTIEGTPDFAYHVFDIIDPKADYQDRMELLESIELPSFCVKVLPVVVENESELLLQEEKCLNQGYEGLMIRDPDGPYKYGRSTQKQGWLCKLKRFSDAEAVIVGFEELQHNMNTLTTSKTGHAKRSHKEEGMIPAGTLGAFVVEREDGSQFKVATGLTQEERQRYWDTRDSLLGQLVKYKYQEAGAKDLPRFPVFLGIRHPDDT